MSRLATAAASFFWVLLLSAATYVSWRHGAYHPDEIYLIGIPLIMLALTAILARYSRQSRYRVLYLTAGSVLAVSAASVWGGVWGAGV